MYNVYIYIYIHSYYIYIYIYIYIYTHICRVKSWQRCLAARWTARRLRDAARCHAKHASLLVYTTCDYMWYIGIHI